MKFVPTAILAMPRMGENVQVFIIVTVLCHFRLEPSLTGTTFRRIPLLSHLACVFLVSSGMRTDRMGMIRITGT